jgi:uncharacterized membrane protein
MPGWTIAIAAGCFGAAALSLYILSRYAWVRTTRATILALAFLLAFTYWQAGEAEEEMRALGLIVTATLMILPALTGALAGALLGYRHRTRTRDDI